MDNTTCYCRNPQCPLYGRMAPYAQLKLGGWHRQAVHFRCQVCPALVSARTGTAYAGIRTDATTYLQQIPRNSRQNSRPSKQVDQSFLCLGSTPFRFKFSVVSLNIRDDSALL